ncbi:hypothetical protein AAFC00_001798 [Neodothiora populina]|uniref:UTP23 sensor motif region domain-containing protein n=1 Tax=Neodothiora populina TaxID=2781224 RepID=A0ABR3PQE9_9PEZI
MRGKRSKQYRKLMHQYQLAFNFREPYQVLVDAQIVQDAARFSMPLAPALERTIQGKVKPMITQCSMRHLYTAQGLDQAVKNACIDTAKTFERRRCNHHTLEEPLSALECISSVVDPKSSATNKHRYVVASQDRAVRARMRAIPGVPLIYINRSVMIMEPMSSKTEHVRDAEERGKVRAGLKGGRGPSSSAPALKRKRSDDDDEQDGGSDDGRKDGADTPAGQEPMSKKKRKGPKGPNPLSVRKSKKTTEAATKSEEQKAVAKATKKDPQAAEKALSAGSGTDAVSQPSSDQPEKRPRRRKHKSAAAADNATHGDAEVAANTALVAEA